MVSTFPEQNIGVCSHLLTKRDILDSERNDECSLYCKRRVYLYFMEINNNLNIIEIIQL